MNTNNQIVKKQIPKPAIIVLIALLQLTHVFATDMYMPAMPIMAEYFGVDGNAVNLTLFVFFLCSPIGILIFGALSDKYGRKPILYGGLFVYIITSIICAVSPTVWVMLAVRVLQAIAAGAMGSVATALAKDCFDGKVREEVLIVVQAAFIVGPIVAPIIGAQIMLVATWREMFFVLAGFGVICGLLVLPLKESLPLNMRNPEPAFKSLGRLGVVIKEKRFLVFLLVTTTFGALPFSSYLTFSPYIYEVFFGLSPQEFSLYLGLACGISVIGLIIYRLLRNIISLKTLTTILVLASGLAGVGLLLIGRMSPVIFFILIVLYQTTGMIIRPYSTNTLLEIQTRDVGSASAIMNCSFNAIGCIGLALVMVANGDNILSVGALVVIGALISLGLWIFFLRSKLTLPGIKD